MIPIFPNIAFVSWAWSGNVCVTSRSSVLTCRAAASARAVRFRRHALADPRRLAAVMIPMMVEVLRETGTRENERELHATSKTS